MISFLLNYSLPVVGLELCLVFLITRLFLEPHFMPRVFGKTYLDMDMGARRSLTNHVVSFGLKITCCVGVYSILETFFVNTPLDDPIKTKHLKHQVTNGDILAYCYLTVPTIYIFEIIYRTNISVVSAIHHIAAILINALGIVIIIERDQEGYLPLIEFKLILIYGTFEMMFEMFPHLAVLLYRAMRDRPRFLSRLFFVVSLGIFTGTLSEQVAIIYFYHRIWNHIPILYKALGPILHVCFLAAQVHGGRICMQISTKLRREVKEAQLKDAIPADGSPLSQHERVDLEAGCSQAEAVSCQRHLRTTSDASEHDDEDIPEQDCSTKVQ
ncbi:hypothetical protein NEOLEDRAFT_1115720 [Neolentinus lepideus HHB14362 ss-1]|uniref:TLC domain-containing protein n=1 Tax=Neolentinus lepideus HHB14362 ss-1 TaxID=1314782 RepID=A0A165S378_9AGAM|nr:hypothetical protein NEOLEDRAFT_1115720 [Neolentinus lepideus HHB14362 ss-1]